MFNLPNNMEFVYQYPPNAMKLVHYYADEETVYMIYELQFLIPFTLRWLTIDGDLQESEERVSKMLISLHWDDPSEGVYAEVTPYTGNSHYPQSMIRFPDARSVVAVLSRMGYQPRLPVN